MTRTNAPWGLIGLLSLSGLMACTAAKSAATPPLPVRTAKVQSISVGNPLKYSASIIPYTQVELAFKSNGYLERILQVRSADRRMRNVDEGDFVTRGTVLAVVQQQDYKDKLQQAEAQLSRSEAEHQKAKLSYDRTTALYSTKSATKPDMDSAQAQLDSTTASVSTAKAQLSEAQVALGYCQLRAPFNGWIVKRTVDAGSLVGPATNGFTIADLRTLKAVFGIPDTMVSKIKRGQTVQLTTDAVPGPISGRVSAISTSADAKSRVYSVEVSIANAANKFKAGMIATLELGAEALASPVTGVPLDAVIHDPQRPDGFAVMVAEGQGDSTIARLRPVELGKPYGNMVAVTSGVAVNETVITTGVSLIKNGDVVRQLP
jgi:RND family efflux transporter, MFP subunit